VTRRVETVTIVGRDAALWLAAAAIQRALGPTGVKVRVVELSSWLSSVDAYVALPSLGSMHRLLSIDEQSLLKAARGVPMVGQRFSNWSKAAPPFLIAYDDEPPPSGDLPFTHYWVKGHNEGLRVGIEDFSLGCAVARLGRVPTGASGGEEAPLGASYGYHLEAGAYVHALKHLVLGRGVEAVTAAIANVIVDGETIEAVELADGSRIEADLFIDASGTERALIGRMPGTQFESWRDLFPCDRMLCASGPPLKSLPAFSQVSAVRGGWIGLFPLQDRVAVTAVYDTKIVRDEDIAQQIEVLARIPVSGDVVVSELKQGVLNCPWIANCVAVGDAAAPLEPLDAAPLHIVQGCISHLISLFPATAGDMPEALAYNRSIRELAGNIRDFQTAHYKLNRRFDEPLWDRCREMHVPDSLRRKIDLFSARAGISLYNEETFFEQTWTLLFLGHGIEPEGYDPRIDVASDEAHIEQVQQRLRAVAELARSMPTIEQFLGLDQPLDAARVG
jgi:tryptophan halogenase